LRTPPWPATFSLALAVLVGFAASAVRVPLAWVLGPLLATAICSVLGVPIIAPTMGRRFGQAIVGTSVGLYVTAQALGTIAFWLPAIVATALIAMLCAALLSVPLSRAAQIDHKTAFFSLTPGGLSEMANVGIQAGAQPEPIALSQALRVALLVCLMPPLIIALGIEGELVPSGANVRLGWGESSIALLCGVAGVVLARLLRFNNPWTVGAILGAAVLSANGLVSGRIPGILLAFGQFLIGISIGARFRRESLARLPRLFVLSAVFIIILTAILFGYAALLSAATGLDLASAALGSSPGGMAEMALTAQVLHLNVALVTAFHVVRAFLVNAFTLHFYGAVEKVGLFNATEALLDRCSGRRQR
jgi:uncharacterized protein